MQGVGGTHFVSGHDVYSASARRNYPESMGPPVRHSNLMVSVNAHIFVLRLLRTSNGFGECDSPHSQGGTLAGCTPGVGGVELNSAFLSSTNQV